MHRHLGEARAGVLQLLDQFEADHAAVEVRVMRSSAAADQAEIAVDVAQLEAEEQLHRPVVEAADDDAADRVGALIL